MHTKSRMGQLKSGAQMDLLCCVLGPTMFFCFFLIRATMLLDGICLHVKDRHVGEMFLFVSKKPESGGFGVSG